MKKRIWRILAIAVVLGILPVLIPATPALAQPDITLSPSSGSVGTKVTVTGTNFESFVDTEIHIFFDNTEIENSPLTVPEGGTFIVDFNVPVDAGPGIAYVKVKTMLGGEAATSKPPISDEEKKQNDAKKFLEGTGFEDILD